MLDYIPASGYFDLKEQLFGPLYQAGMRTALWEIPGFCRTITSVGEAGGTAGRGDAEDEADDDGDDDRADNGGR